MFKFLKIWLMSVMVAVVFSLPFQKDEEHDCPENFCSIALFKCISEDSCNGTLIPPAGPCNCCPSCLNYSDEGELCGSADNAEDKLATDAELPSSMDDKLKESSEVKDERTKCKPGLTCLMGICVHTL